MITEKIKKATDVLKTGGVIAFPTDTVFGMGCLSSLEEPASRIYEIKGRSFTQPLPILISCTRELVRFVKMSPLDKKLAALFWPGALTLILPLKEKHPFAPSVLQGQRTIAVRMPGHAETLALIRAAGEPLATTSANRSGELPLETSQDVQHVFGDQIDFVLDGSAIGHASTILQVEGDDFKVLREGDLTEAHIREKLAL